MHGVRRRKAQAVSAATVQRCTVHERCTAPRCGVPRCGVQTVLLEDPGQHVLTRCPNPDPNQDAVSLPYCWKICGSMSLSGCERTRRLMVTTCRSLVPVALEMLRGRMRTSKMCGVCSHGMRKCVPSPFTPLCERGRAASVKRQAPCMHVGDQLQPRFAPLGGARGELHTCTPRRRSNITARKPPSTL